MAKVELKRGELMSQITISVDMKEVEKECFGFFHWRKHLASFLIMCAARILGMGLEFDNKEV